MNAKNMLISIVIVLLGVVGFLTYKVSQKPYFETQPLQPRGLGQNQNSGERTSGGNGPSQGQSKKNCLSDECLAFNDLTYPVGDLTEDAKTALNKALDDEYKAWATYQAVIDKHGSVRPFIMIIRAEEQHISSLKALFDKYGLTIPENPYTAKITSPETPVDACKTGVGAEIANAALYKDNLLPKVTDYEDITTVFTNLMDASQEKHLPAFQRCSQ